MEKIEFVVSRQEIVSGEKEVIECIVHRVYRVKLSELYCVRVGTEAVENDPEKGDIDCDSNFDASSEVFWFDSDEVDPA